MANAGERLVLACGELIPKSRALDAICDVERFTFLHCPEEPDVVFSLCKKLQPSVLIASQLFLQAQPRDRVLRLTTEEGDLRVLAVLERNESVITTEMLLLGCRGALLSPIAPAQLKRALHAVMDGEVWAPRRVISALLMDLRRQVVSRTEHGLTARESDILDLTVRGYKNSEIAAALFISPETVRWHKRRLYRKLGECRSTKLASGAVSHSLAPAQNS